MPTPVLASTSVAGGHAGRAPGGTGYSNGADGHGNGNGANGHANGSNGRGTEPAWLQKLKTGAFDED